MPSHPTPHGPYPAGLNIRAGAVGGGKEGVFSVPHQAWGYLNLLLSVGGGCAALENLPVSSLFGAGGQGPPEPPSCIQPCPSLLPGGTWCRSQPPQCAPKNFFTGVNVAVGVMELLPQTAPLPWAGAPGLGVLPGTSCCILVVNESHREKQPPSRSSTFGSQI